MELGDIRKWKLPASPRIHIVPTKEVWYPQLAKISLFSGTALSLQTPHSQGFWSTLWLCQGSCAYALVLTIVIDLEVSLGLVGQNRKASGTRNLLVPICMFLSWALFLWVHICRCLRYAGLGRPHWWWTKAFAWMLVRDKMASGSPAFIMVRIKDPLICQHVLPYLQF